MSVRAVKVTAAPRRIGTARFTSRLSAAVSLSLVPTSRMALKTSSRLVVEALAGGFGQADDIAFRSAIRVAATPFGCTHFWTSISAGQNLILAHMSAGANARQLRVFCLGRVVAVLPASPARPLEEPG